jgi:DnaJ-class molecular chaperone
MNSTTPFSPPAVGYVHAVPYPRWQKCPICEGTGYVYPKGSVTLSPDLCDVCDGQKVLDSWTGLPTKEES